MGQAHKFQHLSHLLIYFLKIEYVRTQFRFHGFVPESCYLCACCWNLCVCYLPGHSSVTRAVAPRGHTNFGGMHTKLLRVDSMEYTRIFYVDLTTWK